MTDTPLTLYDLLYFGLGFIIIQAFITIKNFINKKNNKSKTIEIELKDGIVITNEKVNKIIEILNS